MVLGIIVLSICENVDENYVNLNRLRRISNASCIVIAIGFLTIILPYMGVMFSD